MTRTRRAGGQEGRGAEGGKSVFRPKITPALLLSCFLSLLAFGVPFLVYLFTLPPGITWAYQGADAGDLMTAAITLGVPHPPGYPTYTLIGWSFSKLPLGTVAWRFNLLSAISVAAAAWLLFKIIARLTGSRLAALVSAWSLAFASLVWSQAIITEVYGVNLFFVGLLLWLGLQIRQGRTRYIFWLGLAFGLSLGVHLTNLFLAPLFIWFIVKGQRTKAKGSLFTLLVGGLIFGLLIFAYLPLRAGKGAITWGTPNTLVGFWELVSGQIYRPYLFAAPAHLLVPRLLAVVQRLTQPGFLALVLAGFGLRRLWYHARDLFWGGLITAGFYIAYALGYNTVDSYVYLLPVFVFMSLWAGAGARDILDGVANRYYRAILGGLFLVIPLFLAAANAPRLSLQNDATAEKFWQTTMGQAPPQAVLLTSQDNHTLTLWYARFVLQQRLDVVTVDTRLVDYPWHQADLLRIAPDLSDLGSLTRIFEQNGAYHRPLCLVSTRNSGETVLSCIGE